MNILVAGNSSDPFLIEGIQKGFREFFPNVNFLGVKAVLTERREKPLVGIKVFENANQKCLMVESKEKNSKFNYIISISNGIVNVEGKKFYSCICFLKDSKGNHAWGISQGLEIQKDSTASKTKINEIQRKGISKITNNAITEIDLISNSVVMALSHLIV